MESQFNLIAIFLLILTSITFLVLSFAKPKQKGDIANRLEKIKTNYDNEKQKVINKEKKTDILKLEFDQFSKRISPFTSKTLKPKTEEVYRKKLNQAGRYDVEVMTFMSLRILSAIVAPVLFILVSLLLFDLAFDDYVLAFFFIAILGYFYPLARLNSLVQLRHRRIFRALPDILDLLTICLEAGMGINEALTKVVDKSRPSPLRDEINRTLQEIQVGNPRIQALRDLGKRVELKELTSVLIAIIQAEQMGTSLSKTLKIQSEIIRDIRWQKAQEQAQKAPVKIIIPVALFIFPTIFMVIFGPLVINYLSGN